MTSDGESGGAEWNADAMGSVLYYLADGLLPFNGRPPTHRTWTSVVAFDIDKSVDGERRTLTLQRLVGGAATPLAPAWFFERVIDETEALVRTVATRMLRCASVSRAMARAVLPHWKHVFAVVRVLGRLRKSGFLLPRHTSKAELPPRLPASWYRMAVVRYLTGQWAHRYRHDLRTGYYRMAPTFLALTTAWETADRVIRCGLAEKTPRPGELALETWSTDPVGAREWLRKRYEARLATERHAAAFRQRMKVLWRRGKAGRDEESGDWHY